MPAGGITRRSALAGLGLAAGAGAVGLAGERAHWFGRRASAQERASVGSWVRERPSPYYVAHRGSGDVLPEHTLPAYRAARGWGAQCLEISVAVTADGVLVCMHDLTLDRTTNRTGRISTLPYSALKDARVVQPQLGPAWTAAPPAIPLLEDVLTELGGRAVLCLEAKDDAAYPAMMAAVERHGLQDSVVVKAFRGSTRIGQAQTAGHPVFAYLGADDLTAAAVRGLAAQLRPDRDYLGLPAFTSAGDYVDDDLVRAAVASRVPVWVYPVHRRIDVAHYSALGVAATVCSSYGYLAGTVRPQTRDSWASRMIAPGEMTRHPDQRSSAPAWTGRGELTLARGAMQFVTLGQLSPVGTADGAYRVELQARWPRVPADPAARLSLVFGHTDDRYYESGLGTSTGYEASLRADGGLTLRAHVEGSTADLVLADATTPALADGRWVSLRLSVTPSTITWARTDLDADVAAARDLRSRGPYLHLGRLSPPPSQVAFRAMTVT